MAAADEVPWPAAAFGCWRGLETGHSAEETPIVAIVTFGGGVAGIRGTIAGSTFSANAGGPYVKCWSTCSNPRTYRQSSQRAVLAFMSARWRGLGQGDKDDWDAWAALPGQALENSLGQTYYVCGALWHAKINVRLTRMGRALRTVPPVADRPAAPTLSALDVFETGVGGDQLTWPNLEFDTFDIVVQLGMSVSTAPVRFSSASYVEVLLKEAPVGAAAEVLDDLDDFFGLIQDYQRAFCRAYRQTSDGLRSAGGTIYADVQ